MCKKLEVSRAGYYKWLNRKETKEELENKQIALWLQEYDEKYKHTLGYRRMRNYINRDKKKNYSKRRIQRMLKLLGIKAVIRRSRNRYKASTPETTAENILKRNFSAEHPNEKWTTDVTEFKIPESGRKLYLSGILDLYDRSIVSYVLQNRNDNKLVFDTFDLAVETNPTATPLFHSDRGFQYTSKVFQAKLNQQGMEQSMSRVGHCIDNGPIEGFWGIIKSEMYYISKFYTEKELRQAIKKFIDYYNNARYQERFHNLAPMEVRAAALQAEAPVQYPIPENKRIAAFWANIKSKKQKTA
jgi:transposase InsO family protein